MIFLKFLLEYSENQKGAAPLIRLLSQTPSPRGEGSERGSYFNFKRRVTVRYETGDARPRGEGSERGGYFNFKRRVTVRYETGNARPRGEGSERGSYFNFRQFATVRYETPCGCVMKRAMPAPEGKALKEAVILISNAE